MSGWTNTGTDNWAWQDGKAVALAGAENLRMQQQLFGISEGDVCLLEYEVPELEAGGALYINVNFGNSYNKDITAAGKYQAYFIASTDNPFVRLGRNQATDKNRQLRQCFN